jgi:hypothetical protein
MRQRLYTADEFTRYGTKMKSSAERDAKIESRKAKGRASYRGRKPAQSIVSDNAGAIFARPMVYHRG